MTDCKNLFRGAARLGVMVSALEVPFARVTGFVEAMSGELEAYQSMASTCLVSLPEGFTTG